MFNLIYLILVVHLYLVMVNDSSTDHLVDEGYSTEPAEATPRHTIGATRVYSFDIPVPTVVQRAVSMRVLV